MSSIDRGHCGSPARRSYSSPEGSSRCSISTSITAIAPRPYLANTFVWARNARDERIGLVGTVLHYPLTGNDISNHVETLELRTSDLAATRIRDCATWRETVNRKQLDYVLVTTGGYPVGQTSTAREERWTATDPAAWLVLTDRDGKARAWLYQVQGRLDPSACP